MHGPTLEDVFKECKDILERRKTEYNKWGDFSTFETAARIAGCDEDTIFRTLISVKLARVEMGGNFHDSLIDIINYCALWIVYKEK